MNIHEYQGKKILKEAGVAVPAGYVAYTSDREIVGFQLNGSSDGMMLDALPGM